MQQRIQKSFRDALVFEKKYKMILNGTGYMVFKERLENCCSNFSRKLRSLKKRNDEYNYKDFINFNEYNVYENEKENNGDKEEQSFVYEDKDINEEIFSAFVKCINGEEIKIKEDNSIGLMILSIEFGYERLKKECEEYISKEHSKIRDEIKEMIKQMINHKNKKQENDKNKQEERYFDEFERIIGKYFNIAIEEENEIIKNLPIESFIILNFQLKT